MTLSYECVSQNFFSAGLEIGETVVVVEDDGRCYEIKRMSEDYCKVREVS